MENNRSFLEADDGSKSYARLSGLLLIIAFIIWGSYITYVKDSIPDIPLTIAGTILTLYGINKAFTGKSGTDTEQKEEIK